MSAEQLVPLPETCQRLVSAGFPQETHFGWFIDRIEQEPYVSERTGRAFAAALTLAEVLAVLPPSIIRAPVNKPEGGEWFLTTSALYGGTIVRVCYDSRLGGTMPLGIPHGMASREAGSYAEAAARLYLALHAANLLPS